MNSKATPNPKTAAAKESTPKALKTSSAKANAKGRKASQRNLRQETSQQDQAQELPTYATRPVQLHECLGICVIFLDSNPLGDSDPTFIDRFREALATRDLELLVTTETEVFDLLLRPFCLDKPSEAEGAEAPAPVEPSTGSAPGSAAR